MENQIEFQSEKKIPAGWRYSYALSELLLFISIFCSVLIFSVFVALFFYNIFMRFYEPDGVIHGRWLGGLLPLWWPLAVSVVSFVLGILLGIGDNNNKASKFNAGILLAAIILSLISGGLLLFVIIPLLLAKVWKNIPKIKTLKIAFYSVTFLFGIAYFINYLWYDSRVSLASVKCNRIKDSRVAVNGMVDPFVEDRGQKERIECHKMIEAKFRGRPIINYDLNS